MPLLGVPELGVTALEQADAGFIPRKSVFQVTSPASRARQDLSTRPARPQGRAFAGVSADAVMGLFRNGHP